MIGKMNIKLNNIIYILLVVAIFEGSMMLVVHFFSEKKDLNPLNFDLKSSIGTLDYDGIEQNEKNRVLRKIVYIKKKTSSKFMIREETTINHFYKTPFKLYSPKVKYIPLKFSEIQKNREAVLEKIIHRIEPRTEEDILTFKGQSVPPVVYTKSVELASLSIQAKKRTFINMMIPSILLAKHKMKEEKNQIASLMNKEMLTKTEESWLEQKREEFEATSNSELYEKMSVHPTSIIIAQAIIESGWGTSRFFQKANNVFGIWSFSEEESRMKASKKRGKKSVYVKKYTSVEQSIYDYFLVLSTKDAYASFRKKSLSTQNPYELINYLGNYSELREEYIENLRNTIRQNQLQKYDDYVLALR